MSRKHSFERLSYDNKGEVATPLPVGTHGLRCSNGKQSLDLLWNEDSKHFEIRSGTGYLLFTASCANVIKVRVVGSKEYF